ncbi:hypothetical protein [Moraxella bovis]|uniref:Uncharacterized protein n=1 Tax=Moraxella bovis TaxID=476 RepID=A0A378PRL9_MORBO|nr:hypothetical protein [Moraxella bovis]STY91226.1 Uncharacterised protein [Moraxella bovis]
MTHPVKSYAAFSATTPLAPYAFERRRVIFGVFVIIEDMVVAKNHTAPTHG